MTNIIVYAILLISAALSFMLGKYAVPWLKDKHLYEVAKSVVQSAEALYGRGHGEEKLAAALESLKERGYDIESSRVIEAVRSAWKELDQAMYADGEKQPE
jgi:hypothetical protein